MKKTYIVHYGYYNLHCDGAGLLKTGAGRSREMISCWMAR